MSLTLNKSSNNISHSPYLKTAVILVSFFDMEIMLWNQLC